MKRQANGIGAMCERLVIQENAPEPISVTSVTRVTTTATATTAEAHWYTTGDFVTVAGAVPAAYNGKVKITVTGATTFTYVVAGAPATPATGTISVIYVSDAQGGRKIGWEELVTIWAQVIPMRVMESLQAQALSSKVDYRFRARARADVTAEMRALWMPQWPPNSPMHTLEIHGVLPDVDGRAYMILEAGEVV